MNTNERIAKVLGWVVTEHGTYRQDGWRAHRYELLPDFEHDIAACFEWLVPWATERGWRLELAQEPEGEWSAMWGPHPPRICHDGATPAAAICNAFLWSFEVPHAD